MISSFTGDGVVVTNSRGGAGVRPLLKIDTSLQEEENQQPYQQPQSLPPPLVPIRSIQFGLISPDEARRISVVNVTKARLFDSGAPCEESLFDLRMGSTLRQFKCATCDMKFKDCPGHFGRVELASPVFHPNFLDTVVKVLNCVCLECSALLVAKNEAFVTQQLRTRGWKKRLRHVHEQLKGKKNKCCIGTPLADRFRVPLDQFRSNSSGSATGGGNVAPASSSGGGGGGGSNVGGGGDESFVAFGPEAAERRRSCENVQSLEGGCGHWQPKIVRSGIKVVAKWPEPPASTTRAALASAADEDDEDEKDNEDDDVDDKLVSASKKRKKDAATAAVQPARKRKQSAASTAVAIDQQAPSASAGPASAGLASAAGEEESAIANVATHPAGGTTREIPPEEVYAILQRISDYDIHLLGFDPLYGHPSWMVLNVLLVPPPCTRPSIPTPHGKKAMAQDHLTIGLLEIVKKNNMLERQLTHGLSACVSHFKALLQYHVSTYLDNESKFVPKATLDSGRPRMSISQRFKTKKGRVRGNLMGKRVDFSARSVITPDANIALNELGVPFSVAMTTTYPERVFALNLDKMQRCVDLGPEAQYGAKYVIDEQGRSIDLRFKRDVKLRVGFIVERHLRDGDLVAFNRAPSLHKFSIQSHYARLMPGSTFRLNLSATTPYNADFDGDEMNMHAAQSIEAVAELQHLMNVQDNLVGAASNKPSMGLVQDSLLAARCFTMRNTFLDRAQVMQLLMTVPTVSCKPGFRLPQPCILRPRALWSGKQLVSMLLPSTLNMRAQAPFKPEERELSDEEQAKEDARQATLSAEQKAAEAKEKEWCDQLLSASDTRVLIRGGELISGILEKGTLGSKHGSIVHILNNDLGSMQARIFLEEMQAMMHYYFAEIRGFSIGIGDMMASADTKRRVRDVLQQTRSKVAALVDEWQQKKRSFASSSASSSSASSYSSAGASAEEYERAENQFEAQMNRVLNQARDQAGRVASASLPVNSNNLKLIVTSGSKGSDINIAQLVGSVGQQNVDGKRVPCGLRDRALPYAKKNDLNDIESRGFVSGSYVDGLTPIEQFTHAMGGREGLIDTAVKTSKIGYIQRRLVKAMEDVAVTHDRTVRNSLGDVVQFVYGADDMDGAAFEWQEVPLLALSNADIERQYGFSSLDADSFASFVARDDVREALHNPASVTSSAMRSEVATLRYMRDLMRESLPTDDDRWPLPVHVERLVRSVIQQHEQNEQAEKRRGQQQSASDIDPLVALRQLETLRSNCVRMYDPLAARPVAVEKGRGREEEESEQQHHHRWERMHSSLIFFMMQVHGLLSPRKAMEHWRLSSAAYTQIIEQLEQRLLKSKISAGEATGTLAAQSIGEPATQMTLNTFHYAGISEKNVTLGVPRLEEIIRVTRKVATPSMTLHLLFERPSAALYADKQQRKLLDERLALRAKTLASRISGLTIKSLLLQGKATIVREQEAPLPVRALVAGWRATEHPCYKSSASAALGEPLPFLLCLPISRIALHRRQMAVSTLAAAIQAHYEGHVAVMHSDDNDVDLSFVGGDCSGDGGGGGIVVLQMYKTQLYDALAAQATATNNSNSASSSGNSSGSSNGNEESTTSDSANLNAPTSMLACEFDDAWRRVGIDGCMPLVLKQLQSETLQIALDGLDGISGASVRKQPRPLYDRVTGERVDGFAEWIVETDGSALLDSFALEGVDHRLTTCNHPLEVYEALGIEAVRESLVRELRKVLTFDGSYVNYRHLALLADVMTHGGSVMAINRFGLNRRQTGPLMRCTLEESVQMLMDAGIYSEFDPTTGPSERVALGRRVEHGTGTNFQVLATAAAAATKQPHARELATAATVSRLPRLAAPFVNTARISPFAIASRETFFESQEVGKPEALTTATAIAAAGAASGTKISSLDAALIGVNPFAATRSASTPDESNNVAAAATSTILGSTVHEHAVAKQPHVERRIGTFVFRSPFATADTSAVSAAAPLLNPFSSGSTFSVPTASNNDNKRPRGFVPSTPRKRLRISGAGACGAVVVAENGYRPSTPKRICFVE